jgi:hypothetical protein
MPENPEDRRPSPLQLLEELQRLEDEHRTLDLRDPAALDRHRRRIDALRQKIAALSMEKTRSRVAI